jgi:hypothetical protein
MLNKNHAEFGWPRACACNCASAKTVEQKPQRQKRCGLAKRRLAAGISGEAKTLPLRFAEAWVRARGYKGSLSRGKIRRWFWERCQAPRLDGRGTASRRVATRGRGASLVDAASYVLLRLGSDPALLWPSAASSPAVLL